MSGQGSSSSTGSKRPSASTTKYMSPSGGSNGSHYRGITFDDFLYPHVITSAPPPPEAEKRSRSRNGRHSNKATSEGSRPELSLLIPPPSLPTSVPLPSNISEENLKKLSGGGGGGGGGEGKSRMRATARAFVRGLSVIKKGGSQEEGEYDDEEFVVVTPIM